MIFDEAVRNARTDIFSREAQSTVGYLGLFNWKWQDDREKNNPGACAEDFGACSAAHDYIRHLIGGFNTKRPGRSCGIEGGFQPFVPRRAELSTVLSLVQRRTRCTVSALLHADRPGGPTGLAAVRKPGLSQQLPGPRGSSLAGQQAGKIARYARARGQDSTQWSVANTAVASARVPSLRLSSTVTRERQSYSGPTGRNIAVLLSPRTSDGLRLL